MDGVKIAPSAAILANLQSSSGSEGSCKRIQPAAVGCGRFGGGCPYNSHQRLYKHRMERVRIGRRCQQSPFLPTYIGRRRVRSLHGSWRCSSVRSARSLKRTSRLYLAGLENVVGQVDATCVQQYIHMRIDSRLTSSRAGYSRSSNRIYTCPNCSRDP